MYQQMNKFDSRLVTTQKSSQDQKKNLITATYIAGAIGGIINKFLTHPLDTIRAKIQVEQSQFKIGKHSFIETLKATLKTGGIYELYRGYSIVLIAGTPAGMLYYGIYESTKHKIADNLHLNQFLTYFIAGMAAEAVSCILFVPIDVIKERLQVQNSLNSYKYNGSFDAVKQISKSEGLRGLYRAYGATIASWGPHSGLSWIFYESLKNNFVKKDQTIGPFQSSFFAFLSAGLSGFITNPLDLAKLRMQVQRAEKNFNDKNSSLEKGRFGYKNMFQGIYKIIKIEGPLALWRGSWTRILYMAAQFGINLSIVEKIRNSSVFKS